MIYLIALNSQEGHACARDLGLDGGEYKLILESIQMIGLNCEHIYLTVGRWKYKPYKEVEEIVYRLKLLKKLRENKNYNEAKSCCPRCSYQPDSPTENKKNKRKAWF